MSHRKIAWAIAAGLALGCGSSPANPWKPGEVDLVHVDPCSAGTASGTYSESCTYVGRDAAGDSVPGATAEWKVEPGIVPLVTTTLDPVGRLRVAFSTPATPGDSAQLWMCASTLPPPCTLIRYEGVVFH